MYVSYPLFILIFNVLYYHSLQTTPLFTLYLALHPTPYFQDNHTAHAFYPVFAHILFFLLNLINEDRERFVSTGDPNASPPTTIPSRHPLYLPFVYLPLV